MKLSKKDIHTFFKAIRDKDNQKVIGLVSENPEYINITRPSPPKKDEGQTGLQVALKTENFEIADFLIENGSDVNHKTGQPGNERWFPVLHAAIQATFFNSYTMRVDNTNFEKAFNLLKKMLEKKADPNIKDSIGNDCLTRAFLDANQMIDNPAANLESTVFLAQINRIFKLIIEYGADIHSRDFHGKSIKEWIKEYDYIKYIKI